MESQMDIIQQMFDQPFFWRALIAGVCVALASGVLGCFVVWQRMAYFGDALSHAALLGIALGVLSGIGMGAGVVLCSLCFALLLVWLSSRQMVGTDTLLGVLSHAALACGLIVISSMETVRVDLMSYLLGDILSIQPEDIYWMLGLLAFVLAGLWALWPSLLAVATNEDIAYVEGVKVEAVRLAFVLLLALVIAISMRLVGIMLITALLIIPAAAARRFSSTPLQMAGLAAVNGVVAVVCGLAASMLWNLPSGAAIVAAAATLYAGSLLFGRGRA